MKKFLYTIVLFSMFVSVHYSQVEWQKHGSPVFNLGTLPSWDDGYVGYGSVIYDGMIFKMWYAGSRSDFILQVGYATSFDGITWERYTSNPVMTLGSPGSFDEGSVWGLSVIYDESVYKMWYSGSSPTTLDSWRIGYAVSTDGVNWTKHPSHVLDVGSPGEWDDLLIAMPSVIKEGSLYKMWYHGGRAYRSGHIGYATSTDGVNWIKHDDPSTTNPPHAESDPVFKTGEKGSWNSDVIWQPNVIYNNIFQGYEMWYVASGDDPTFTGQNMGYANSLDGTRWNQPLSTPVMQIGEQVQFDDQYLLAPMVNFGSDHVYRMWYTGSGGSPKRWRIGYATGLY